MTYIYIYIYIYISCVVFTNEDLWRRLSVDCRNAYGWLGRCGTGKSGCSDCSKRSGLVWLLRLPGSSSGGVSPWGWLSRVFKGGDNLVDGTAPGLTVSSKCQPLVEGLLEGVFKTFLWRPSVSVASGEFAIQGYIGEAMPSSFWRHALPIITVTSATWPLCRWFVPDQETSLSI